MTRELAIDLWLQPLMVLLETTVIVRLQMHLLADDVLAAVSCDYHNDTWIGHCDFNHSWYYWKPPWLLDYKCIYWPMTCLQLWVVIITMTRELAIVTSTTHGTTAWKPPWLLNWKYIYHPMTCLSCEYHNNTSLLLQPLTVSLESLETTVIVKSLLLHPLPCISLSLPT